MGRKPGPSVRLKLAASYAGFLMVAGLLMVAVVWVFLLRYVPDRVGTVTATGAPDDPFGPRMFNPGRDDLWRAFAPKAALMLGFLLVLGLLGGWWLAGRMLAPLHRITQTTRAVEHGSLSQRIRLPGRSDEFRELADAFDAMLASLEARVAEQQRFAANASHELRTPLAITQTLLDVAREDPGSDTRHLIERLHAVNTRAIDLTEALLMLSRADLRAFKPERVDLCLAAEEATETLLPLAEKCGASIEVSGETAFATGSPTLLLQLTTNLVHNAVVHNLPERGRVWVRTGVHEGTVRLIVENTGRHLPDALVSTLAEPFQRGAERARENRADLAGKGRADQAGVGLGLGIAESIVRAHDGTLTLSSRSDGGLRVEVRLPAWSTD